MLNVELKPFLRELYYFTSHEDIPEWNVCIHPEGGRYFHNATKVPVYIMNQGKDFNLDLQRIFTDADLYDPACFHEITKAISIIDNFISAYNIQIPERTDLVLDLCEEDGDPFIGYYFANHELRIVLFLQKIASSIIPYWNDIKGVSSGTHLRMSSLSRQSHNTP